MIRLRPLIAPALLLLGIAGITFAQAEVGRRFGIAPLGRNGRNALQMAAYLGLAWLLSRIFGQLLARLRPQSRPLPKLLGDLVSALLFLTAIVSGILLILGHGAGSALAGSGVVLALFGFAIRNVVADTLSGIALGLEAPFRIGDWVDIEGLGRGRVVEIGWRTTRLLTRDSTYVILPNSQVSRQRIVNYSAPRSEFRAQMEIKLGHATPAAEGADLLHKALREAPLIRQSPAPDVRIQAIEPDGVRYALRYWLGRFDHEWECRDAIWREVDAALRRAGIPLAQPPVALLCAREGGATPGAGMPAGVPVDLR
ncbi:mechanosensitive ion channel family protein (plasmid) [Cereibacter sphaeroides]|uniref:mechanosensitive ion channel family protein n=1 Tax=Cereibacter sphaeroides TaxID=1063 RepID=UPI000F54890C|nr:mechanosensitive ion channel family protein [Cereibacter sphaeroides]AZB57983.1 mechanosensitive ion channel family protein [Cereibacter sphaeroides]